jgi:PKD repeat protein
MKKLLLFCLLLPVILISCEKMPQARFHTDTVNPEVGQEVFFINDSYNSNSFEWDFGDGYISDAINPSHVYSSTGTFEVKLTSISDGGMDDVSSLTITVLVPTLLEIEVREYYDKYLVPGASVILYPTLPDWDAQKNSVAEGYTNSDGVVVFSGLGPYVYYADVWEKNHDNYTLAAEDAGFIRTAEVIPHKINRFTAWVDIADHGKGMAGGTRQIIIKKFERKAGLENQQNQGFMSNNWKELYNISIPAKK